MKATELRIGNLNVWDYCIQEVDANQLSSMQYGNIESEGIRLTEEWLVKFGANKVSDGIFRIGNYEIGITSGMVYNGLCVVNEGCLILYVHQLQNLYFALMGRELICF